MLTHREGDVVAPGEPALVEEGELPLGRRQVPEGGLAQADPAVVVAGMPGDERALQAPLGGQGGEAVGGRLDPEEALPVGSVKSMNGPWSLGVQVGGNDSR